MDWSQLAWNMAPSLGFGGATGAVVGFTAKKVTKVAAVMLGVIFIVIQGLSYYGWISVNWGVVESRATGLLMDSHGTIVVDRFWNIITSNLSFGAAFTAGFVLGFNKG